MKRQYERTHPWLTFNADLERASADLWMLLGEAASKCEHIAGVPLKPETAERLHLIYLAKGVRATTAIEGNTLSEAQVVEQIEGKLKLPPSKEYLAKEVANIVSACNRILNQCRENRPPLLTVELIHQFDATVLEGLELDEGVVPGQVRHHSVGVARYRGAPHEDCPYLLQRLCDWLNGPGLDDSDGKKIHIAVLKAILAHLYLAWIHPFGDGNGRTARLVEFLILVCAGIPSPAAHLLSNHYNETRTEYYRQLDRASQSGGDVRGFISYAVRGFVDGLRAQLGVIRDQQYEVAWINWVYERFHDQDSPADQRRLRLVLDLARQHASVQFTDIGMISPKVAQLYANRTPRTLLRDLEHLRHMGLVVWEDGLYRANWQAIMAFLPFQSKRAGAPEPAPLQDYDDDLPGTDTEIGTPAAGTAPETP